MPSARRILAFAATAASIAVGSSLVLVQSAQAERAADTSASLVEDYSYPGAKAIEDDLKIKLIAGDGHIMLAKCDSSDNLITVESYHDVKQPIYCFAVSGPTGYLQLEIPNVYFVWAGDKKVTATVTVNGAKQDPVEVAANDGEPVGAADPKGHALLLELKV